MKKHLLKYTVTLFFFFFTLSITNAQSFTEGLHLGVKLGASQFLGETGSDISGRLEEFNNTFGLAYDIELAKYFGSHLEIGIEVGQSTLKGDTDNPQFSAEGFHHSMGLGIDDPVEYENKLFSQKIFLSYYLRDVANEGEGFYLNPFVRAGAGHIVYNAKLQYQDPADGGVIFSKGIKEYNQTSMSTAVFFFGGGIKASLSNNISLMASAIFNHVTYDFLDAVYNYSPTGERLELNGMYSEFKVGVFYNFGNGGGAGSFGSKKGSKSRRNSNPSSTHLPFARK